MHYDPRDVTYVYVRTPGGTLVKAAVTTPGVSAISLPEWSARRQHERASCRDPAFVEASGASLRRNDPLVRHAKSSPTARRSQATDAAGDHFHDTSSHNHHVASEHRDAHHNSRTNSVLSNNA